MENDLIIALEALKRKREAKEREFNAELARLDRMILEMEMIIRQESPEALPEISSEYAGLGIAEAAARYLASIGRPAPAREISMELRKRGVTSAAKNFDQVVYMTLRNNKGKLFDQLEDRRWIVVPAEREKPARVENVKVTAAKVRNA